MLGNPNPKISKRKFVKCVYCKTRVHVDDAFIYNKHNCCKDCYWYMNRVIGD